VGMHGAPHGAMHRYAHRIVMCVREGGHSIVEQEQLIQKRQPKRQVDGGAMASASSASESRADARAAPRAGKERSCPHALQIQ